MSNIALSQHTAPNDDDPLEDDSTLLVGASDLSKRKHSHAINATN